MSLLVLIVSKTRFPIGLALSSVFVSLIITFWLLEFAFSDSESEVGATIMFFILVGYILFLLGYFVTNEGRKYTVSAFSISAILASIADGMYTARVGGWFWNDDYVLEDALLASIRPVIILFVINELVGLAVRVYNGTANILQLEDNIQNNSTSLIRIGLVASLPLCVSWGLGMFILVPILVIFFILYWASTDAPLSLKFH